VSQGADDGVYSFSLSRSTLYPKIYVLSLGRCLFSSVTFKEDFHSFVTMLVLFFSLGNRQWEAVIESTAKMIVLLVKCLESYNTDRVALGVAASHLMTDQCLEHQNAES